MKSNFFFSFYTHKETNKARTRGIDGTTKPNSGEKLQLCCHFINFFSLKILKKKFQNDDTHTPDI